MILDENARLLYKSPVPAGTELAKAQVMPVVVKVVVPIRGLGAANERCRCAGSVCSGLASG